MTDQFPQKDTIEEELAQLAKQIPALPSDYADLRRLLALLPSPMASENPNPDMGNPALNSIGAAQPSQSSSPLLGPAPGTTPAASIALTGVITHGWQPYATMQGLDATDVLTTAHDLAANGGMIVVPVEITAPMMLERVSIWNTDTASERSWNWGLYEQVLSVTSSKTLTRIAAGMAADTFTPGAASKRAISHYSITSVPQTGIDSSNPKIFTPDSAYAYYQSATSIKRIRVSDNLVVNSIFKSNGNTLAGKLAMNPAGTYLYVAETVVNGNVYVISTATNAVVAEITGVGVAGGGTSEIVITPDGQFVYVIVTGGIIKVIRTSDNTVLTTVGTYTTAMNLTVSPDSSAVWFSRDDVDTVSRIQTSDHTVIATIPSITNTTAMAMHPAGTYLYAGLAAVGIKVIRTSDNTVFATITTTGYNPYDGFSITPDGAYIYYADPGRSRMEVIRTSDNTIIKTFNGTLGPSCSKATFTPDSQFAYVPSDDGGTVTVVRVSDNAIMEVLLVGSGPSYVNISPDGLRIYCGVAWDSFRCAVLYPVFALMVSPGLYWLAIHNNHVTNTFGLGSAASGTLSHDRAQSKTLLVPNSPSSIAFGSTPNSRYTDFAVALPNSTRVYMLSSNDDNIPVIDTDTASGTFNTKIATLTGLGTNLDFAVMKQTGDYLYAIDGSATGYIRVVRTSDNTVVANVAAGAYPRKACITPDGAYLYISTYSSTVGTVLVFRTSDNTIIETITTFPYSDTMAVTPDGQYVYVASYAYNKLGKIRTSDNTLVNTITIPTGTTGWRYGILATNDYMYGANYSSSTVDILRVSDDVMVGQIDVETQPHQIIFNPAGTHIYVLSQDGPTVKDIDLSVNRVVGTAKFGGGLGTMTITPDGLLLYAGGMDTDTVTLIRTSDFQVVDTIRLVPQYSYPGASVMLPNGKWVYYCTEGGLSEAKALPVGDLSQVDFVLATWAKHTGVYAAVMEGRVFGQTAAF